MREGRGRENKKGIEKERKKKFGPLAPSLETHDPSPVHCSQTKYNNLHISWF
jgi:hypothetical protein